MIYWLAMPLAMVTQAGRAEELERVNCQRLLGFGGTTYQRMQPPVSGLHVWATPAVYGIHFVRAAQLELQNGISAPYHQMKGEYSHRAATHKTIGAGVARSSWTGDYKPTSALVDHRQELNIPTRSYAIAVGQGICGESRSFCMRW